MRKLSLVALALACGLNLSCGGRSVAPRSDGQLEVFVHWEDQVLPDRQLMIVELRLVRWTDARGLAVFRTPPGSYTLRAYVNSGGPPASRDMEVVVQSGLTEHVDVSDCLPCMSPQ